jgi:hypothetical protein
VIWLVWRRQRVAMTAAIGLVALVGLTTVIWRLVLVARARDLGVTSCLREVSAGVCETEIWWSYLQEVSTFHYLLALAAIATPAAAGALAGSGLFGGELSRGTHVFALSQGISRLGWWSRGLLVAGLPVTAAVAAVTPVVVWASRPFGHTTDPDPLSPSVFLTSGLAPAGYTVLAFSVAAAAGLLLRSTVRALVLAVAVQIVVLVLTTIWLRPAYLPPETRQVPLPSTQSGLEMSLDPPNARNIDYGFVSARGDLVPFDEVLPFSACTVPPASDEFECVTSKGFVAYYSRFQPGSRYWPFQFIETGLLLVLATSALGAGLWGLRRRVH